MNFTENYNYISAYIQTHENLLEGIRPTVRCKSGEKPIIKAHRRGLSKPEYLDILTNEPSAEPHIDIIPGLCALTFDLGNLTLVDRFVILSFYDRGLKNDYTVREFKIFGSDSDLNLFSDENLIYAHRNFDPWEGSASCRTGKHADAMIDFETREIRYFGVKFSEDNPTDDILRLGYMALYNKQHDKEVYLVREYFSENRLKPEFIKIEGEYEGNLNSVCEGFGFGGNGIKIENAKIIIKGNAAFDATHIYIAAKDENALTVNGKTPSSVADELGFLYYAEIDQTEKTVIDILNPTVITEIGINCGVRRFDVTDRVINENFYGVGTNTIPYLFSDVGYRHGMNDAFWLEEYRRTMLSPPSIVRLWFQPDWFIIDEESYYSHVYDFDTPKMQSVYKYLDMYKAAGCEILFNCGWKVTDRIHDWYCIPGVQSPRCSAPRDIDEFAFSCGAVLKELIENRGYDNIKYLTFYNEPNYGYPDEGDFVVSPPVERQEGYVNYPKLEYWIEMLKKTKTELVKIGLDKIEMWGPETSCGDNTKIWWANEFRDRVSDILDMHTTHRYNLSGDECETFCDFMLEAADKPLVITEFNCFNIYKNWHRSVIEMIISYARSGASGAFHWLQSGTYVPESEFALAGDDLAWNPVCEEPDRVNNYFYHLCLFMRYVPAHSKVLYSGAYDKNTRIAAFLTPAGDTVIAVEDRGLETERTYKIGLPDMSEKTFYRFSIKDQTDTSIHAHIPYCSNIIKAKGTICDKVDEDYTFTMYTTQKPIEQITVDKGYIELNVGDCTEITYSLHDTDAENVEFSIAEGNDFIELCENKITAKAVGTAAVRLAICGSSATGYDIVLIKVV